MMAPLQDLSIYDGIDDEGLPDDRQGFPSSVSPVFEAVVNEVKPKTVIEIGSHKGISACRWADLCGPDAIVYCVDTWLGGFDQMRPDLNYAMPKRRGYPTTYFQFLANVKRNGFEKQIVPIPNTSVIGALLLKREGVMAELVYVDGSHDGEDCLRDCRDYWPLVKPGGIMLVDDYSTFTGVYAGVSWFVESHKLWDQFKLSGDREFAVIRKPALGTIS